MGKYVKRVKAEINAAIHTIHNYNNLESVDKWKEAEKEFGAISRRAEELIFGNGDRHTDKVSHQAIRFSNDIPKNWEIMGNILYGDDIEKRMPCFLFTWLLNMDKNLWKRLQSKIRNKDIAFKDKRIAGLLEKSQSKTPNVNNEVKIADLFLCNFSKTPNNDKYYDYDLAFMMVIRFLTLFELPICANANKSSCMTWFENEYGILRHIFTYNGNVLDENTLAKVCDLSGKTYTENIYNAMRAHIINKVIWNISLLPNEEMPLVEYFKNFNEHIQAIRDEILVLDFSNKDNLKNKTDKLINDIRQLKDENYLLFRYELFKSNYALNNQLSFDTANPYVQMCQLFDADFYTEELIIENSKGDNSQSDFILNEVKAKIESLSKLSLIQSDSNNCDANNNCDDNNKAILILNDDNDSDDNDGKSKPILIYDCEYTANYNNKKYNFKSDDLANFTPFGLIDKLDILFNPHDIILKGKLTNLSAKYSACGTEFILSCDNIEVDNARMKNVQFNFKKNSAVLKSKNKKEEWYNLIFLLLANEI